MADAQVICRQLGYHDALQAILLASSSFDQGFIVQPVWFSDVDCEGTEVSILNCSLSIVAGREWNHAEDAGVVCKINQTFGKYLIIKHSR